MCKVMPSLDLTRLLDLPLSKLLKLAALVEEMTGQSLILDDGVNTKAAGNVRDGFGVSQEQADQTSAALSSALKNIKK